MAINYRFQIAGHAAAAWTASNPVLNEREFAAETDTGKFKLGDGATAWNALAYLTFWSSFGRLSGAVADNAALVTAFGGKEPTIAAGSAGQYWRYDKTWATLAGSVVANTPAGNIAATTVQAALNELDSEKVAATEKGAASGVATLDAGGKVPTSQLPALAITSTFVVNSQAAQLALTAQEGDVAVRTDLNKSYIHNTGVAGTMADWQELLTPTDTVISVNGMTGAVTVSTITGNAGTATALQTARNIDGQAFDGSAAITVVAPGTHAATSKATPVDADELPLVDSAASNVLKKLTWANLKATLKTYLDTLYQALNSNLTTIAGLTPTTDNFIVSVASAWASRTPAQVRTTLALGTSALVDTGTSGTKVPLLNAANTWSGLQTFNAGWALPNNSSQVVTVPQYSVGFPNSYVVAAGASGILQISAVDVLTWTTTGVSVAGGLAATGAVSGTNITSGGNVTGNAATATKLATARNINGVAFDGSANITINAVDATGRIASTEKGAANGVATLDSSSKIPTSQLPALAITSTSVVNSQAAQLALTAQEGDVAVRTDLNKSYIHNGGVAGTMADWQEMLTPTDTVISVNGMTGAVTVTTITGNAGTATALQTARNIDAQAFDGTGNITVIAPGTHAATSKATPVDADEVPLVDSAASNVLKKLTWANVKATLKTYFDTLYQALNSNLTTIGGLTATTDNFIVSVASAWASRTPAQVRTTLALGTSALIDTGTSGTKVPLLNAANTWAGAQTFNAGLSLLNDNALFVTVPRFTGGAPNSYVNADATATLLILQSPSNAGQITLSNTAVTITSATTASAANMFQSASGGPLLRSTSSRRYKRNIEDVDSTYLDAALSLRPRWYRSKAEADNPAWGHWGFVAEEVAKIDPRLVHWSYLDKDYDVIRHRERGPDGKVRIVRECRVKPGATLVPESVQYERLTVLLLGIAQRQHAQLAAVETRVAALEHAKAR